MHLVEVNLTSILLAGTVTTTHIDGVVLYILLHHIPWTSTQAKALALSNCVEPVAVMLSKFTSCLYLDYWSTLHSQVTANKVVVINLSQEANTLTVLASSVWQFYLLSDFTHARLGYRTNGENKMTQLVVGNLREEVGLIFDRVNCCSQVFGAVNLACSGIVSCGSEIKVLSPALLEIPKFYHAVAHHVGIRSESSFNSAQSILHDIVPILLMQRHDLERQAIAMSNEVAHLDVFLGTAVALVVIHSNANVEKLQVVLCLLNKLMHHNCAVDST